MDKLELDARVARLERRFSQLLTLPFLILALLGIAAVSLTFLARSNAIATPATPAAATVVTIEDDRSMHRLDGELRKLNGLLSTGLIERDDFRAKKKGLFAPILHIEDFAGDMQLAKKLLDENIIDKDEYGELKKKILQIRD